MTIRKSEIRYYPRRARCQNCTDCHNDCSRLPFHTMPVYRQDGVDTVVICTEFRQANYCESLRQVARVRPNRSDLSESLR
ncbi:hypothetical protein [Metapseudomonas otitidis]|uniref:hypothetical protein n=1 Tax=Metapseudomonas otitidis TaxID=319939 RepID=UPI0013F67B48|nr:hypothetical protein [Pseudomonas otitidis]